MIRHVFAGLHVVVIFALGTLAACQSEETTIGGVPADTRVSDLSEEQVRSVCEAISQTYVEALCPTAEEHCAHEAAGFLLNFELDMADCDQLEAECLADADNWEEDCADTETAVQFCIEDLTADQASGSSQYTVEQRLDCTVASANIERAELSGLNCGSTQEDFDEWNENLNAAVAERDRVCAAR